VAADLAPPDRSLVTFSALIANGQVAQIFPSNSIQTDFGNQYFILQ
jgi:hypothetical protein